MSLTARNSTCVHTNSGRAFNLFLAWLVIIYDKQTFLDALIVNLLNYFLFVQCLYLFSCEGIFEYFQLQLLFWRDSCLYVSELSYTLFKCLKKDFYQNNCYFSNLSGAFQQLNNLYLYFLMAAIVLRSFICFRNILMHVFFCPSCWWYLRLQYLLLVSLHWSIWWFSWHCLTD